MKIPINFPPYAYLGFFENLSLGFILPTLDKTDNVLDIGCGDGYLCNCLAQKLQKPVIGLDISSKGFTKAHKTCQKFKTCHLIKCLDGKAEDLKNIVKSEKLNVITLVHSFHHILVRISACGAYHTELDKIEGRTASPEIPIIPGHEVVGRVEKKRSLAARFKTGDRVGIGWINSSCGTWWFYASRRENLCESFTTSDRDANGGYAEYMTVMEDSAYSIPANIRRYGDFLSNFTLTLIKMNQQLNPVKID